MQTVFARELGQLENGTVEKVIPHVLDSYPEQGGNVLRKMGQDEEEGGTSPSHLTSQNAGLELCDEIHLKNGIVVYTKHTNFSDDEVLIRGRRWGGCSEYVTNEGVEVEARGAFQVGRKFKFLIAFTNISSKILNKNATIIIIQFACKV